MEFINNKGEPDKVIISDCDKWMSFDKKSKGKINNHVFHNSCLKHIIAYSEKERSDKNLPPIKINIFHTDNCPTQYKCCQNFRKVSTHCKHNAGTLMVHKFSQKYWFRGGLGCHWEARQICYPEK